MASDLQEDSSLTQVQQRAPLPVFRRRSPALLMRQQHAFPLMLGGATRPEYNADFEWKRKSTKEEPLTWTVSLKRRGTRRHVCME